MVQANPCRSIWYSLQHDFEGRAETSTTALRFNLAIVEVDEAFRNCESETKSAELSRHRRIGLLKWLKQRSQPLRLNSNPGIGNLKMKTSSFVVGRTDGDLSALRGEFHCVVYQVPKHLLKPDTVSKDL